MTDPAPPGRRRAPGAAAPLLQVRQLNVAYGDVQVLWDVHLDVYPGEIVALVGANGAGKSTLLATLSGLLAPRSGEILLSGQPIAGRPRTRTGRGGPGPCAGGAAALPRADRDGKPAAGRVPAPRPGGD